VLLPRVITALMLLAILLPALFAASPTPFIALSLVLIAAAAWEWARLNGLKGGAAIATGAACLAVCVALWWGGAVERPLPLLWIAVALAWVLGGAVVLRRGVAGWPQLPLVLRWVIGISALCVAWLAMAQARRIGVNLGVMYLDLDGFKEVNDRLGHDVGDVLLVQFAQRLQAAVRASDTVCRQGGDEFVVLLPGMDGVEPACLVARKILAACDAAFELAGQPVRVGVSGGIALFPQHGSPFDELSRHADGAMYAAKRGGRMRFMLYRGPDAEPEVVLPESDLAATAR